jgi:hypothetical protein
LNQTDDLERANRITEKEAPPGRIVPAFSRERIGPWNYKQRRNLAIFFLHSAERQKCGKLLREIAANYGEYQRLETEALAIAQDEIDRNWPKTVGVVIRNPSEFCNYCAV